ncbi:MAG: SRPBCC family protein [Sporichthyaceae bacterium]
MNGEREIRVTVDIQAAPEIIWPMVADPAGMGEWSSESTGARWKGGATGPAAGAKFKGKNRNGWRRWSADGTITTFDVNRGVEWDITFYGMKICRWGYQIEPLPDGASRVTETWQDHRNAFLRSPAPGYIITGQKDRPATNRSSMESTLAKIKATAEARSSS